MTIDQNASFIMEFSLTERYEFEAISGLSNNLVKS